MGVTKNDSTMKSEADQAQRKNLEVEIQQDKNENKSMFHNVILDYIYLKLCHVCKFMICNGLTVFTCCVDCKIILQKKMILKFRELLCSLAMFVYCITV